MATTPTPDPTAPVYTTDAPAERFVISTTNPAVLDVVKAITALGAAIDKNVPCGNNKLLAIEALEAVEDRARRAITTKADWR